MSYKYSDLLRRRAERFIQSLEMMNINGRLIEDSFRGYSVKVYIEKKGRSCGNVVIYYSPKKEKFTLSTVELNRNIQQLETCWENRLLEDSDDLEPLNGYHIFVDGSYFDGSVGYGVVILDNGDVIEELSGKVDEPHFLGMNQVGGELVSVLMAVEWCSNNQIDSVSLHYDYKGIYHWANGDWKTNKPGTLLYHQEAQKWDIKIDWQKVESHSGNRWNDQADRLAKKGAGKIDQDKKEENVFNIERRAIDFLNYINTEGIFGSYMGIINEQFARISIDHSGYIDIYNTKKRSINDPYIYGFNETKQKDVENLWNQFLYGNKKEEDQLGQLMKMTFKNAHYYYNILKNYRDCEFDFIGFATALNDVSQLTKDQNINFTKLRFNFDLLEAHYKRIMKETDYGHQSNPR